MEDQALVALLLGMLSIAVGAWIAWRRSKAPKWEVRTPGSNVHIRYEATGGGQLPKMVYHRESRGLVVHWETE